MTEPSVIMKHFFNLLVITTILFIYAVCIPHVYSAITVSVTDTSGMPGSTVDVSINVDNAIGIAGGDIILAFDSNILTVKSVDKTTLTSDFTLMSDSILEQVKISMARAIGITEGSGALVKIAFLVNEMATPGSTSSLSLEKASLYDENSNAIAVNTVNGTFKVMTPKIESITISGSPTKAGGEIAVTAMGTSGFTAKFSIAGISEATDVLMTESETGIYTGVYKVKADAPEVTDASVTVNINGISKVADTKITIDNTPPALSNYGTAAKVIRDDILTISVLSEANAN